MENDVRLKLTSAMLLFLNYLIDRFYVDMNGKGKFWLLQIPCSAINKIKKETGLNTYSALCLYIK